MKKWRVEFLADGKWQLYGIYGDRFIPQLAGAIGSLVKMGYEVYKTLRVKESKRDG